jgi:hypothetical protein
MCEKVNKIISYNAPEGDVLTPVWCPIALQEIVSSKESKRG